MSEGPTAPPAYDAAGGYSYNKPRVGDSSVAPYPPQPGYGAAAPPGGYGYGQPPPPPVQAYPPPQAYGQPAPTAYQDYPTGGTYADGEEHNAFNAGSFSDKVIRHRFIRKVYLILMTQLLFTAAIVAIFVAVDEVKFWVRRNAWFYYLAYATFLVTYIALACCPGVRMKFPGNYIALGVFTAMFSYVCAAIASFHNAQAVLIAAGITALVTFSISMFAVQTKIDFTMCYGLIFAASMVLLFLGLAFIIVYAVIPPGEDGKNHYYLQCAYGGIAALILSLFLVFDTQRIVGGKNRKNPISPEEHILGAMELYLDIVYLFLIILSFFGGSKD